MIERCCFPRLLRIDGKAYYVGPPSVRQAVEILHVMDHLEDSDDVELLCELVHSLDWKRQPFIGTIKNAYNNNPVGFSVALHKTISQGYSLPDDYKKGKEEGLNDWDMATESYRRVFGGSSWEVWNTVPFVYFLQKLNKLSKHNALNQMDRAIANNPSKESIAAWSEHLPKAKKSTHAMMFENLSPEEIEKEKELARKQYMRN